MGLHRRSCCTAKVKDHMFITDTFETAHANMAFDEQLTEKALLNYTEPIFRFYEWPDIASLTFTKGKPIPNDLTTYDHAARLTGGGIVFHCPKDVVFCVIMGAQDPRFPKGAKAKMQWLSEQLKQILEEHFHLSVQMGGQEGPQNIQFCNSYPNPYELYVEGHKCCAIAVRKYRSLLVMQGVLHLQSTRCYFDKEAYASYYTKGLSIPATAAIQKIKNHIVA